ATARRSGRSSNRAGRTIASGDAGCATIPWSCTRHSTRRIGPRSRASSRSKTCSPARSRVGMAGWRRGEPILLRERFRDRLWAVRPVRLVEDTPERVAVFLAAGTRWLRPVGSDASPLRIQSDDWLLRETDWVVNSALRVWTPGSVHSVLLWWHPTT